MTELFEAAPGTIFKLPDVKLDDVRQQAEAMLKKGELFSSFGLCGTDPSPAPRALHLISQLGGLSLPSYERPIASNAKPAKPSALINKTFAYVPLDEPIDISTNPERPQAVKPGYAFLSMVTEAHTVHIPADQVALELVLTENDTGLNGEWILYCRNQPNPNT